ncbi:hypothetical protein CPB86DRAFT_800727, partial [Serendipita vermifera]
MQLAFILPLLTVILAVAANPDNRIVQIGKLGAQPAACLRPIANWGSQVLTSNNCSTSDPNTLWTMIASPDQINRTFYLKAYLHDGGDKCLSVNTYTAGSQLWIQGCSDSELGST